MGGTVQSRIPAGSPQSRIPTGGTPHRIPMGGTIQSRIPAGALPISEYWRGPSIQTRPFRTARKQHPPCLREVGSSMVTAGATANTTKENSRASRESCCLGSYSHRDNTRGEGRHRLNLYRAPLPSRRPASGTSAAPLR